MLHPVARADLQAFELLDDRDVVCASGAFAGPQQLARRHVAVVIDVARNADRHAGECLLIERDEFLDARQIEPVVPGGAEHAEHRIGAEPVYVGPVLLVVDPRHAFVKTGLNHLLPHRFLIVTADRGRDDIGLQLLQPQEVRREIARVLRHQDLPDDFSALRFDQLPCGFRRVVAPHVVVRQKHPVVAVDLHRVLDDRLREVAAVAVPYELGAMAVLPGLGR